MKKGWTRAIVGALGAITALTSPCYGQLTIIPQSAVQEASNPSIAEGSKLAFDNNGTLSFDTIGESDGCWQGEIAWHTTGGTKATITRITTSCNCVVADWSRRDNTARKSGKIGVRYYPKGHAGRVEQRLFIYTTLSEEKPSAIVKVVGTVTPSGDNSGNYPHTMGVLLVRQKEVTLPADGGVARIAVMNGGSAPLEVSHDGGLSLGGLKAYTIPRTLQSGEEGDLVVEFEPNGAPTMLYLKGVNVPPRERKIEIRIEKNR